jgi:hypothetical protein
MFKLFKKKIDPQMHVSMMGKIFSILPKRFQYISNQLSEGIVIGVKKNEKPKLAFGFSLDIDLLNKYEDKKGSYFAIKRVFVNDLNSKEPVELQIKIGYGILLSYMPMNVREFAPSLEDINVDNHIVEYYENNDFQFIKKVLTEEELGLLNPNDIYLLDIEGKKYYHLFDIADGDFIGIDINKKVYRITHDPFEIIRLDQTLVDALKEYR